MDDVVKKSSFPDPVTPGEITNMVKILKNGAHGLMKSIPRYYNCLIFLCNRSLIEGVFSSELKLANVLPLFKNRVMPCCLKNYCIVPLLSWLCTLSKVAEKVIYSRLLNFLDKVLISNQFGLRKLHSWLWCWWWIKWPKLWIMGKRLQVSLYTCQRHLIFLDNDPFLIWILFVIFLFTSHAILFTEMHVLTNPIFINFVHCYMDIDCTFYLMHEIKMFNHIQYGMKLLIHP